MVVRLLRSENYQSSVKRDSNNPPLLEELQAGAIVNRVLLTENW